jgi:hypothetical protein
LTAFCTIVVIAQIALAATAAVAIIVRTLPKR